MCRASFFNGGLLPIIQPFAALYVLILAVLGPVLTKEAKWIYKGLDKVCKFSCLPHEQKAREKPVSSES